MAKLKADPITQADLAEYIASHSDFGFELSVLKMLRDRDIECKHGGLYDDPVTVKSREFDIRASVDQGDYRVKLAIECNNIRSNFPLLVACMPRHKSESYHHVVKVSEPQYMELERIYGSQKKSRAAQLTVSGSHSVYPPEVAVGKSIVQVGRAQNKDGELMSGDGELFDKWAQCLSSLADLVRDMYWEYIDKDSCLALATAFPILVVPNGRLWAVRYDSDGDIIEPQQVDRIPCYVGKEYEVGTGEVAQRFVASHIELMTVKGLIHYMDTFLASEAGIERFFHPDAVFNFVVHQPMPRQK
jgi:hypothetical protein